MRRNWRGRYRNNWYRGNNRRKVTTESSSSNSFDNSSGSVLNSSASRAPAAQLPIVIPIFSNKDVWKLYFPMEGNYFLLLPQVSCSQIQFNFSIILDQQSKADMSENIDCFKQYIQKNRSLFDLEKIDHTRSVALDMQCLLSDSDFSNKWSKFQADLFEKPERTLRLLEYCFHEV